MVIIVVNRPLSRNGGKAEDHEVPEEERLSQRSCKRKTFKAEKRQLLPDVLNSAKKKTAEWTMWCH